MPDQENDQSANADATQVEQAQNQPDQTQASKTFTQEELNSQIQSRLDREKSKFERDLADAKSKIPSEEQLKKFQEFEQKSKEAEEEVLKTRGEWDTMKASLQDAHKKELTTAQEAVLKERAVIESLVIDKQLADGAIKGNAIEPAIVSKLLRDQIKLDENHNAYVVDAEGNKVFEGGELLSVEKFVQQYLEKNLFLVRASSANAGSGYQPSTTPAKGGVSTDNPSDLLGKALEVAFSKAQ